MVDNKVYVIIKSYIRNFILHIFAPVKAFFSENITQSFKVFEFQGIAFAKGSQMFLTEVRSTDYCIQKSLALGHFKNIFQY